MRLLLLLQPEQNTAAHTVERELVVRQGLLLKWDSARLVAFMSVSQHGTTSEGYSSSKVPLEQPAKGTLSLQMQPAPIAAASMVAPRDMAML